MMKPRPAGAAGAASSSSSSCARTTGPAPAIVRTIAATINRLMSRGKSAMTVSLDARGNTSTILRSLRLRSLRLSHHGLLQHLHLHHLEHPRRRWLLLVRLPFRGGQPRLAQLLVLQWVVLHDAAHDADAPKEALDLLGAPPDPLLRLVQERSDVLIGDRGQERIIV